MLRRLAPDFNPAVVAAIDARLDAVAVDHGVELVWAIESGSRAWGFPSPDSDYDCRFVFVRSEADYLSPWRPRDVLETPLDAVLDVNGWDLIKAVQLAVVGNATITEWLRSPLVYRGEPDFRDDLLALCEQVADIDAVRRHYLHVGAAQWRRSGAADGGPARLKGVFYALRPAAALRWLREHGSPTPPMNLIDLMAESPPPPAVRDAVDRLIQDKAATRELGQGAVPEPIRDFVQAEFGLAESVRATSQSDRRSRHRELAAAAFIDLVRRWAPGS